jgi:hypothetical protein
VKPRLDLSTMRLEFHAYDLGKQPMFQAFVRDTDGTEHRVGCLHAFYPHCDERYLKSEGYTFMGGFPAGGIPNYTGNWPAAPDATGAAQQLFAYLKYYVDHYATRSEQPDAKVS